MTNELVNLSSNYCNISIQLSKMNKEYENKKKELIILQIDLSYKHII